MRKYSILTIFFITFSFIATAQSSIANERVASLCKVWGFLKYYDPTIASGKLDWDSVFINNIQKAINCKTNTEFNKILLSVINDAGKTYEAKGSKTPDSINTFNEVNIGWITKSTIFDSRIKNKLDYIYNHKNLDSNKYIKIVYNTADFSGENKYEDMGFPDIRYRLLFLSRFWNIINYFAPYKYLTTNWDDVLRNFIPKMINSIDTITYYKTLMELCKSLNDGHSALSLRDQSVIPLDLIFGNFIVPFYCNIIDNKVIVRKVENDSIKVHRGDIILKIDGENVNELIKERARYFPASNKVAELYALSWYLLDGTTSSVTLTIQRGNNIFNISIRRISKSIRNWFDIVNYTSNDVGYKKFDDSVLLIYAGQITDNNLDTLKRMIKQSKAVIFDVRNYPGNDAFFYIVDPFLSEPKLINLSTIALPDKPSLFKWQANAKIGRFNDSAFKGKVVILADERSQSQGEYSCMVLQTIPGAVTIGSQTAGCDGVDTPVPLSGGISLSYSGYGVYYPDKTQTQRIGIKIDIPISKTLESVANGKDEIMDKALQYIKNSKE